MTNATHRYLLFQVRQPQDPMRAQEVRCFSRSLGCAASQIEVLDLIHETPSLDRLRAYDVVLMGGSGDYSVAEGGDWLNRALDAMRELYELNMPTFGSCWGFQAMARATGGEVVTCMERAEVGTFEIQLTDAGIQDPVMGAIGPKFLAHLGHQDIVTRLPPGAILLASSGGGIHQAFTFIGKPIYCTQFHPELNLQAYVERVTQYPEYVERVVGVPLDEFTARCQETPAANTLLARFMKHVFAAST